MRRSHWMFLLSGFLVALPFFAQAAGTDFSGSIVPTECNCPGGAPDWGCVLQTIQNLVQFAVYISITILTLILGYAGILWITSPLNPSNREEGRNMILSSIIGIVIVLSGWLIIDFVMKALYKPTASDGKGGQVGPWNKILGPGTANKCIAPSIGTQGTATNTGTNTNGTGGVTTGTVTGTGTNRNCSTNPSMCATGTTCNTSTGTCDTNSPTTSPGTATGNGTTLSPRVTVASGVIVSQPAQTMLQAILLAAGLTSATISSGYRTPEQQANAMYTNLENNGVAHEKALYGSFGDQVIDAYSAAKAAGQDANGIKAAMVAKINQLGPGRVSAHSDQAHNTFDVAPSSIANTAAFTQALQRAKSSGTISDFITPPRDTSFHIEVTNPI